MNTYYVYAYLREDGTPYYIGKGHSDRAWIKGKNEVAKPADRSRIIIVEANLTNVGALAIERRLIRWYGRIDQQTGILRNQTDGGDGGPGAAKGRTYTEETKKRMSDAKKGKKRKPKSEESKRKMSEIMKGKNVGKIRTEEMRRATSERQKGRTTKPHTEETKQKLRAALMGKKRGPMTEEQKQKISAALKGKPKSPESIKKRKQTMASKQEED